jgi:hypothetical protein
MDARNADLSGGEAMIACTCPCHTSAYARHAPGVKCACLELKPARDDTSVDPVRVSEAWIATCDLCGWHTQPASPKEVVREWARLHRVTCPREAMSVKP